MSDRELAHEVAESWYASWEMPYNEPLRELTDAIVDRAYGIVRDDE